MTEQELENLRYPIGRFVAPPAASPHDIAQWIKVIAEFPKLIQQAVNGLSDSQLDTAYRPDGWTIRQVVHHCADSHINAFTRFKLALTEDLPTIKPYREERWAELSDCIHHPVEPSLQIIQGVHERWVVLLKQLSATDLERRFVHPEHGKEFSLAVTLANYEWHCRHHLAHIVQLKQRLEWN